MRPIDGPRIAARSGTTKSLVVLLHGYGANGQDLIELGRAWQPLLPDTAFVSPNAPDVIPYQQFGGRQWFDLTFRDPTEYWRGVSEAGPALDAFLDREITRHNLPPGKIALVGFSQGTMMALHCGPRRNPQLAAIVGYSGMLAGPERLKGDIRSRPPVLLIHGEQDDVIPVEAIDLGRETLTAAGLSVEWHVRPRLGHGIDPEGLSLGGSFLKAALG